jgi:hypothetical protein
VRVTFFVIQTKRVQSPYLYRESRDTFNWYWIYVTSLFDHRFFPLRNCRSGARKVKVAQRNVNTKLKTVRERRTQVVPGARGVPMRFAMRDMRYTVYRAVRVNACSAAYDIHSGVAQLRASLTSVTPSSNCAAREDAFSEVLGPT